MPVDKTRTNQNKELTESKTSEDEIESNFGAIVLATFTTVFIAELGDKTQIATMLLAAHSGEPLIVFLGAALALICSSLVGVVIGQMLAKAIPAKQFHFMAGALMVGIGLWLGSQATYALLKT